MKQFIVFLIAISLFSCAKDDVFKPDEPEFSPKEFVFRSNIQYGNDNANVMDIYLPANRSVTATKVILLIHGGAWFGGDKADESFAPFVDSVRRRLPDWAIFNLNYRLATITGNNRFPAQETDVETAVKFIYNQRQNYSISDKWVLAGASAGAHLAMLHSYKSKNWTVIKPKAVIDFFGPTDLTALYNFYVSTGDALSATGLTILLGGRPTDKPQLYQESSPINYVTSQSPPTIIFQGGQDDTVPKEQSETLRDKLTSQGVKNEYVFYPEQTHGWSDPAIWYHSLNKVQSFLSENVP